MVTLKLRLSALCKQNVFIFFSLIFLIIIGLTNNVIAPLFFHIVLVFLPNIYQLFNLWLNTWEKSQTLYTALIVALLGYLIHYSISSQLVQILMLPVLLGIIYLHNKYRIHQRLIYQRHIHTMRVMLRQNTPSNQTVDYSREAVIILDNTGLIIDSNPHVSLLFNLSEDDLIGKPISDVFGILPNFHPSKIPENGEFTWENHNKLIKHIKFRTRPLLDYNTPVGTMLTFFDISEAKIRMEANVQNAKLSVINKLSAGLAHEIRNPLTTIKGFMQLITPDQWPESFRPYQQLILDEIQSIDKVLNKFVLLTCPPAPKMQQLSLIEIIDATIQLIQPLSLRRGITIQQEYASSVYVMGDREQLLQALLSLLNNAIDASPKKGKIIIQLKKYGTNARISVIDEGPGIPINLRNRVLEPFFTTQTGGTGLGLTIAQQIILAHHGKLHFSESKSLAGTEAMIDLPCLTEFTNNLSA